MLGIFFFNKLNKRLVIVTFEMESLVDGGIVEAWYWASKGHSGAISRRDSGGAHCGAI